MKIFDLGVSMEWFPLVRNNPDKYSPHIVRLSTFHTLSAHTWKWLTRTCLVRVSQVWFISFYVLNFSRGAKPYAYILSHFSTGIWNSSLSKTRTHLSISSVLMSWRRRYELFQFAGGCDEKQRLWVFNILSKSVIWIFWTANAGKACLW